VEVRFWFCDESDSWRCRLVVPLVTHGVSIRRQLDASESIDSEPHMLDSQQDMAGRFREEE
jgi:hypothetical protein